MKFYVGNFSERSCTDEESRSRSKGVVQQNMTADLVQIYPRLQYTDIRREMIFMNKPVELLVFHLTWCSFNFVQQIAQGLFSQPLQLEIVVMKNRNQRYIQVPEVLVISKNR